jgi:DNA-binding protein H-NS
LQRNRLKTIHELMERHGLTAADIDGHIGGKQRAKKLVGKADGKPAKTVAKYRDPESGATWSGHGRAPKWIASAKNRDRLLVDASAATVKPAPVSKAKAAGNYVRGPQPAMYQDPKSGATWSGRGRAPAWLAGAKDRAKFLIVGASAAADAKPAVTKAVAKRTPTAKKTAAKKVVSAKVPAKKAPRKSVAVPAPLATVEAGAELTT